jgi:pyruvate dehydrogenase E1 component
MSMTDSSWKHNDFDAENQDWLDSLDAIYQHQGRGRVLDLLRRLQIRASSHGIDLPFSANTPYINTISPTEQPIFPGNREIERRIKSIIRWNAMAMVVRANRKITGIGGHISTYASAATLLEIGFNHFFRGRTYKHPGDIVYFQGHSAPGIYARAFVEGRISEQQLEHFRQELADGGGLSSYPHPKLMPDFWQYPTVSMGLGPIMAIYQARFNRYMHDRGMADTSDQKVWAFLGDGEIDEPESLGAITLASRERLYNLVFVVNCNLQRLDGPVRGNGKVIQELEAAFRGAGWKVIKVVWGTDWDPLIAADSDGSLVKRMEEIPDGQYQKYVVSPGSYIRQDFCNGNQKLHDIFSHYSDAQVQRFRRGGHDPEKVYAAYKLAMEQTNQPTVILAHTIKGYGLGEAGEGKNITHQQKKLNESELREFRSKFGIPISDDDIDKVPFYRPPDDSEEMRYLRARREELGGSLPKRMVTVPAMPSTDESLWAEFYKGSGERTMATTMAFVHLLSKLLVDETYGKCIVPIVPDEARTFGMESLFRKVGIYSHVGQIYEPVDRDTLLYYKEARDGQILEEGITEAGSISSFIAAGTAYATHGVNMIPFFIFYSMFGLQRVGDLVWAAADMQAKGFLLGATAGRTTLAGEGLQHQDGQSHLYSLAFPTLKAYDPAFAFELAVIIRDGLERMYVKNEPWLYYLTVMNEFYTMPAMPEGKKPGDVEEGILRGIYRFKSSGKKGKAQAHLFGSGTILNEVLKAQEMLANDYNIRADVWSVTSYKELYYDAMDAERETLLNQSSNRKPFVASALEGESGVFVAASDYVRALPLSIAKWLPGSLIALGTDGFGRSESRPALRNFFEVDSRYVVIATLSQLERTGELKAGTTASAMKKLGIDAQKVNPLTA